MEETAPDHMAWTSAPSTTDHRAQATRTHRDNMKGRRNQSLEAKNHVESTKGVLIKHIPPQTPSAIQAWRLLSQPLSHNRCAMGTDRLAGVMVAMMSCPRWARECRGDRHPCQTKERPSDSRSCRSKSATIRRQRVARSPLVDSTCTDESRCVQVLEHPTNGVERRTYERCEPVLAKTRNLQPRRCASSASTSTDCHRRPPWIKPWHCRTTTAGACGSPS